MTRNVSIMIAGAFGLSLIGSATAEQKEAGTVLKHSGEAGDLIASRDGVVYWLSTGDNLFPNDIIRASRSNVSTIDYDGCTFTLPEKQDVLLDENFCDLTAVYQPTMAESASEKQIWIDSETVTGSDNAPLIVGGVVLSAGGLAAAANGGSSGTESVVSVASGAASGAVDP
ncbi:MAG: hypothetical protein AAFP81_06175 [Pseudomonadota bacterium]